VVGHRRLPALAPGVHPLEDLELRSFTISGGVVTEEEVRVT
jgi:hypothetical protein